MLDAEQRKEIEGAKILLALKPYLDETEMKILTRMNQIEMTVGGIDRSIKEVHNIIMKYKEFKNRKRKLFPVIKELKKQLARHFKNCTNSSTHVFWAILTETEVVLSEAIGEESKFAGKVVNKLGDKNLSIEEIRHEINEGFNGVTDFYNLIEKDSDLYKVCKNYISYASGFCVDVIKHNDRFYNSENLREQIEKTLAEHTVKNVNIIKDDTLMAQIYIDISIREKALRKLLEKENRYSKNEIKRAKGILTRLKKVSELAKTELDKKLIIDLGIMLGDRIEALKISCEAANMKIDIHDIENFYSYAESLKNMSKAKYKHELRFLKELVSNKEAA